MQTEIYLPELADLSAQELEKIIEKVRKQPDSKAKESLLAKLEQLKKNKSFTSPGNHSGA